MSKGPIAFRDLNQRHPTERVCYFGQKDFRRKFSIDSPIGLCAGLVCAWWSELRKGNDAIRSIQKATPDLIGDVLLSQARSFYLKDFPPINRSLRAYESELLKFKYGEDTVDGIEFLCRLFGVDNCLELDLVLLHDLPILKRWQFSHLASDVLSALREGREAELYVLLVRYWDSKRISGERGHRSAFVMEKTGACCFYDPRWGEMRFSTFAHFAEWFPDYWSTEHWDYYLQRGFPPLHPLQLFAFGGNFSPTARKKNLTLQSRFSSTGLSVDQLNLWLHGLRLPGRQVEDTGAHRAETN